MLSLRSKFKIADRVAVSGIIVRLDEVDHTGRVRMTLGFSRTGTQISLDAGWSDRGVSKLVIGEETWIEGKLIRINHAAAERWVTGTVKLDGYAYSLSFLLADIHPA